jgi:hypothetical protein
MDVQKLKKRVIGMLTDPMHEWRAIVSEREDVASLYQNYIVPLAAIPAVAMFIGLAVVGVPFVGRARIVTALSTAIVIFVQGLVAPIVAAIVIEKLAPKFKSHGSTVDALKLVAYASTPVWVGGAIYVMLYLVALIVVPALYAIYLFYIGLTPIMKTPADSVVPFMVVSAITLVVVNILLRSVLWVFGLPSYGL